MPELIKCGFFRIDLSFGTTAKLIPCFDLFDLVKRFGKIVLIGSFSQSQIYSSEGRSFSYIGSA